MGLRQNWRQGDEIEIERTSSPSKTQGEPWETVLTFKHQGEQWKARRERAKTVFSSS